MRRVIGMDIHRTFAEVVIWEQGQLRRVGRVDMTRTALDGFGKTLQASDEVVVEATGNTIALARVLSPFASGARPDGRHRTEQLRSMPCASSGRSLDIFAPTRRFQRQPKPPRHRPRLWRDRRLSAPPPLLCDPCRRRSRGCGAEDGRCRFGPSPRERRRRSLPESP